MLTTVGTLSLFANAGAESGGAEPVTFRIANGAEIESIDPALISSVNAHRVFTALFEGLVSYDPKTNEPVPGVAESWTASPDQTVFTFKIRKGIT
jgi:oligopeptide transport system substrate-binding protein